LVHGAISDLKQHGCCCHCCYDLESCRSLAEASGGNHHDGLCHAQPSDHNRSAGAGGSRQCRDVRSLAEIFSELGQTDDRLPRIHMRYSKRERSSLGCCSGIQLHRHSPPTLSVADVWLKSDWCWRKHGQRHCQWARQIQEVGSCRPRNGVG
jgi:hypothetical protein